MVVVLYAKVEENGNAKISCSPQLCTKAPQMMPEHIIPASLVVKDWQHCPGKWTTMHVCKYTGAALVALCAVIGHNPLPGAEAGLILFDFFSFSTPFTLSFFILI